MAFQGLYRRFAILLYRPQLVLLQLIDTNKWNESTKWDTSLKTIRKIEKAAAFLMESSGFSL